MLLMGNYRFHVHISRLLFRLTLFLVKTLLLKTGFIIKRVTAQLYLIMLAGKPHLYSEYIPEKGGYIVLWMYLLLIKPFEDISYLVMLFHRVSSFMLSKMLTSKK